jgi:hypothetical protein
MATLTPYQRAAAAYAAGFRGQALQTAVAVSMAENTSGNPTTINHGYTLANGNQSENSVGLTQINTLAHPQYSVSWLQNPVNNFTAAYSVSRGGTNFGPWTSFAKGLYVPFLSTAKFAVDNVLNNPAQAMNTAKSLGGSSSGSNSSSLSSTANASGTVTATDSSLLSSATSSLTKDIGTALVGTFQSIMKSLPWIPIIEGFVGIAFILVGFILVSENLISGNKTNLAEGASMAAKVVTA